MTKEEIEFIEKNVLSREHIPDELIEIFGGEDDEYYCCDRASVRKENNGTIKLVQNYFLSVDYGGMTEEEIDKHLLGCLSWLKVCSSWETAKDFVKQFMELEGVPEAWKAYVLTIFVTRKFDWTEYEEIWDAVYSSGEERVDNLEQEREWFGMIKDKSGVEAQMLLDLRGAKWTAHILAWCLIEGQYQIIEWLLQNRKTDIEKVLPPLGMAVDFSISPWELIHGANIYPTIEMETYLPMARLLGKTYPGIFGQLFKLLLGLKRFNEVC